MIIFTLAILFVVGSAMAMRYFDNVAVKAKQKDATEEKKDE